MSERKPAQPNRPVGATEPMDRGQARVSGGSTPAHVVMHIQELVLRGVPPGSRYEIRQALEEELALLFASQGLPPSLLALQGKQRLQAGSVRLPPGSDAKGLSRLVAKAVFRSLAR